MKTTGAILILIMVMLMGCTMKKKITRTEIRHDSIVIIKDSVHIEYRDSIRIDTQYLPADNAYITALFECDSLGRVHMKEIVELKAGVRARPTIELRGDTVFVICNCDSAVIYNVYRERYEKEYVGTGSEVTVKDSTSFYEKIVKVRLPWWVWLIIGIGALFGIYKLYRRIT